MNSYNSNYNINKVKGQEVIKNSVDQNLTIMNAIEANDNSRTYQKWKPASKFVVETNKNSRIFVNDNSRIFVRLGL